ncbi:MAG: amidohydrolase family protein [Flavobacteriales bacterium]|nr:amidohydrolase family protein [Flavobacteriales bacterium]
MKSLLHIALMMLASGLLVGQTPSPSQSSNQRILIRYATAHIGNGEVLDNAYIEIQNGEFSRVADGNTSRINESDYDLIIDAEGKQVFPGFIVMDSRLGLTEIDQVNATHDFDETGDILPNVRALPAFNTESKIIATVRTNGVLMAQIAPVGGTISGSSSLVHFDGWNWQDATVKADEGVYMNWPQRYRQTGWWAEPGPVKTNKKYQESLLEVHSYFEEAKAYQALANKQPENLRFESLAGVISGSDRLYIRANWARDILDVVQFVRKYDLKKVTIVGGAEAHLVTTELRENDISVIIDRVHKLPIHPDSPIEEPYWLAGKLVSDGVNVAFATNGDMEAMLSRNLPFQVGTAVHYGLPYEEAIRCLTQIPAALAGVGERYGTLEPGKSATFFLSDGDPLDITTNRVTQAFIEGKMIDLTNHQTELYQKFSEKHGLETQ